MFKLDLKSRGTKDQIANIPWIIDKAREFQENIYFCFIDYAKDWLGGSQQTVENSSRDGNTRLLYLPPEKCLQVRKQQLEPDMEQQTGSKLGKECVKVVYFLPCLFNFYAEYIMRNARLDEAQARIKTAGRTINNLRYADDTTLMAENKEELTSLLMKVKEESEKAGLKLNIQKTKIITSPSSMHETGHSKPVYWDNPKGWDGEEVGGGSGWGTHVHP